MGGISWIHDLVVIGGGTAGLTAAIGAASQGARTALIERDRTGGDCLWTGCVPSKALLAAAERAHQARAGQFLGIDVTGVSVDFSQVMDHVRGAIATLAPHDAPQRLREEGVEVIAASARFAGPDVIATDDGRTFTFRHAVIATGASPVIPPIPGIDDVRIRTSDTIWDLTRLPERLVVLGGGPIGAEMAQAFARLGSRVAVVEMADGLLPREEPAAQQIVAASLAADGVEVWTSTAATRVEASEGGGVLHVEHEGVSVELRFDELLVAVGRRPDTDDLGLEAAQVVLDGRGAISVDARLRTSNPRIYAGGDATMLLPFTHTAAMHGATIVQNAVFGLRRRADHRRVPWVTFTSPEVARVGPSVDEAREQFGDGIRVQTVKHGGLDRAVASAEPDGLTMLVGDPKGKIVGATVVGPRAGETIGEVVVWIANGARLSSIVGTTHAYPTWNESLAAASREELKRRLERLRPVTRLLLSVRRRLMS